MPTLKSQVLHAQAVIAGEALPLFVTPRHHEWLGKDEKERPYTKEALEHSRIVLTGGYKKERTRRVSASSLGDVCTRRVLFQFAGAPRVAEPPHNVDLMDLGSWLHLKWQMEGLSAGWLKSAEQFFHSTDLRLGGSTDGVMAGPTGDELFELKTVGGHIYDRVIKARVPKHEHQLQCEGYFELSGMEVASVVYVCRETGEFNEYRYRTDPLRRQELHRILEDIHDWLDLDTLPAMLEECERHTGSMYRRCPYREFCPAQDRIGVNA